MYIRVHEYCTVIGWHTYGIRNGHFKMFLAKICKVSRDVLGCTRTLFNIYVPSLTEPCYIPLLTDIKHDWSKTRRVLYYTSVHKSTMAL